MANKTNSNVDVEKILAERGATYGRFADNSRVAQRLKDALRSGVGWDKMPAWACEALDQVMSKASRIVTGDPTYIDSWVDISGYATKVVQELQEIKG